MYQIQIQLHQHKTPWICHLTIQFKSSFPKRIQAFCSGLWSLTSHSSVSHKTQTPLWQLVRYLAAPPRADSSPDTGALGPTATNSSPNVMQSYTLDNSECRVFNVSTALGNMQLWTCARFCNYTTIRVPCTWTQLPHFLAACPRTIPQSSKSPAQQLPCCLLHTFLRSLSQKTM